MFITALTEITGYFGKPFLVSVFFPSLFFWMLNLALGVLVMGLTDFLSWWQDLGGLGQGFLTVAFLILVLLTAYILHVFIRALTRLYKGEWSFLQFIPRAMQKRNEERWKKLRTQSEDLRDIVQNLKSRQEAFERLLDRDEPPLPYGTRVNVPVMAQEAAALYDQVRDWTVADYLNDEKWKAMEEQLSSLQARILALSADELNQYRPVVGPGSKADLVFRAPYEFLENLIGQLEQERLAIHWEWSVAFPERLSWVMPTRLGNHIRAAATYSFRRYNLDAAIIWPRLQETLPDKFAERLDEARMNMDLMLVLTTLALVFGVVWGGFFVIMPDALLAMHKWVIASIVFLASIGVARVAYSSATEIALSYGELYKTAFDLYRWDALKALHLDLPPDLESEKDLWGEISGLFYRNYPLKTPWKHN